MHLGRENHTGTWGEKITRTVLGRSEQHEFWISWPEEHHRVTVQKLSWGIWNASEQSSLQMNFGWKRWISFDPSPLPRRNNRENFEARHPCNKRCLSPVRQCLKYNLAKCGWRFRLASLPYARCLYFAFSNFAISKFGRTLRKNSGSKWKLKVLDYFEPR